MQRVLRLIGVVLLFPQGLVPIVLVLLGKNTKSWYLAMHMPDPYRIPVAIAISIIGGIVLLFSQRMRRRVVG